MSLEFIERGHKYRLDGRTVPGVTTLLSKGLPKPALPYWAAKSVAEYVVDDPEGVEKLRQMGRNTAIAALKGVPWEKRDKAAIRGTDVHALAERVVHGEEVEVPDHIHAHVEGCARWLDAFEVEPIRTETRCANRRFWYAGTLDAIVRFGRGPWAGRLALIDWKTSSGVYGETGLQTAAYARAEFLAPEPDVELPVPAVDATGVVHVTDGGSVFYPLSKTPEEIDQAFKVFTHVAWVAQKTDWIKDLVGQPMEVA